jgi:hypothetical protein
VSQNYLRVRADQDAGSYDWCTPSGPCTRVSTLATLIALRDPLHHQPPNSSRISPPLRGIAIPDQTTASRVSPDGPTPRAISDHGGERLAFSPTASPTVVLSVSAPIALTNTKTFSEHLTQVLTFTIERNHDAIPTPIWTVTNNHHFTEVSATFPTTSGIIPFEYVEKKIAYTKITVS